ncbi:luciferase family protein [Streptomyces sp. NPDC046924]|uniref:luciferase domain-containing protein n=1 Tax=Streptomyces sp. NPDC046924 TaxID=3155136 RepID=UPI0033CB8CC2
MKPAQRAMELLRTWPDLTACKAACGTGQALRSAREEIVHFHSERDVDLHLTRRAIQRFHYDLNASTAIQLTPGSSWVTVHLDCATDVDLLLSLVSVALKAHQAPPPPSCPPATAGCNFHRVTVLPRDAVTER